MNSQSQTSEQLMLLPYGEDPCLALAQRLLQDHVSELPRLEKVIVLLPGASEAPRLRHILLKQAAERGYPALLGPQIMAWRTWLNRYPISDKSTTSTYRRELILIEALRQHEDLFGGANLWALADSLLTLFDELTLNHIGLPVKLDDFSRLLANAYGLQQRTLDAQNREAQLVHTLWNAWHQELATRNVIDTKTRTLLQLSASLRDNNGERIYLLAPDITGAAETEWLGQMMAGNKVTLLLHGHYRGKPPRPYHPESPLHRLLCALGGEHCRRTADNDYSLLLDTLFDNSGEQNQTLRERALAFADAVPKSPLAGRLNIFSAQSNEDEARAVELQVRRWLLQGRQRIGIVTENRRLARRVRALLERAGISLEDAAGWALSTTSAAAILEHWLQCVEEDFPYRAMLDLLKSPFFCAPQAREEHLSAVYRLEQDIVLHENIGQGLNRYQQHIAYRQQRLPTDMAEYLQPAALLLERLEQSSEPLVKASRGEKTDTTKLLDLLHQSLEQSGILPQLANDAAGMRLLEELQKMRQAISEERMAMDWLEFRSWLGRSLERYTFQPPTNGQVVSLVGLSQSPLAHFDALILAGVEREFLPGSPATTPFFNDAVRRELGLGSGEELLAERFYHFRRLLEAAPVVLLTHRKHTHDEEVTPSPWLELLQSFHQLAYSHPLADNELEQLLGLNECEVVQRDRSLPSLSVMPQPSLPESLLPARYSASAYQQLMNCPYQFFAGRGLGLSPPEVIREALEKSDYGERVHRCLEALHGDVPGVPGPYTGNWESRHRERAIALLREISQAVFARDLEDNFLHRGWLQRWQEKIPAYIDWQIERATQWRVIEVELQREQAFANTTLHGRLDRCDSDGTQLAIVDYKTGKWAAEEDVLSGEAVQLPFYALLAEGYGQPVGRVEYLALDEMTVSGKVVLEEDTLFELSQATGKRLAELREQMASGVALPAWGDSKTCSYCQMSGVCRRQAWEDYNKKGG